MELVEEFSFEVELAEGLVMPNGPMGTRAVAPFAGGTVHGARINGTFVGGGADWLLVGSDHFGRIDVRAQIRTDDDALLYLSYSGLLELNETVSTAMADHERETAFEDQYCRVALRLETGDDRYGWTNTTLFVARGRMGRSGVAYEVYRLT